MVRNKYFYYLFALNATISLINFVPGILLGDRFDGGMMSLLISIPIGAGLLYVFSRVITKFPGQGLPEILYSVFPGWVSAPLLFIAAITWYFSSIVTLISFTGITNRYISPDISPYIIIIGFVVVVCLTTRLDSESILYALEMFLYMAVPLIVYMIWRALSSPFFSWDSVRQIITYAHNPPNFRSTAAATYVFTGYINMVIFNRIFHQFSMRHIILIILAGTGTLAVSMLGPVGFLGTVGAGEYEFPAFSAMDSLRIRYFIIERMIYVFYFVYMTLSLLNSIVHWHVSKELILGIFGFGKAPVLEKNKRRRRAEWWIIGSFSAIVLTAFTLINQYSLRNMAVIFVESRFVGEFVIIAILIYAAVIRKRRKNA
ncbi:hypothetical protein GNP94_16475 [Paenibacillus campinasensis]|uniref:GerAB/ArcD/ProY family transporter n=1 Tax=Paenibacillus campinasensis TaxID=66347 RepID=A0ABW9T586_9BACL|nr:hypothetical protein [Paenibacillus campinasensis]MUG67586.1 hypothetical protein [Paenibacillus campinasensis]